MPKGRRIRTQEAAERETAFRRAPGNTTRQPHQTRQGQLQQALGNSGVARLVSARIQRQDDSSGGRRRPSLLSDRLTLDPEITAQIRAIEALRSALDPEVVRLNLLQIPDSAVPEPSPLDTPPSPQPEPLVPRGKGPSQPKAASSSDLLRAVVAIPAIDSAIANLRTRATEQVRRDWRSLGTGGQAAVVSSLAVIGGSTLAGAMTDPDARELALSQLNGRVIPVPGLDGLGVELNTKGDNVMLGLHLDVGRFLPESLGFGPGSAEPIGAPPRR